MNWALFACALGAVYFTAFLWRIRRRGWSLAAFLVGILHILFATANSAAPLRALLDDMYMGWQIGLLRFEGRSALIPAAAVLIWALFSAWLSAERPRATWMRVIAWGDLFWLANISGATIVALSAGQFQSAKIQLGEYFEIKGWWVAASLLLVSLSLFGLSAIWAYRQSNPTRSHLA